MAPPSPSNESTLGSGAGIASNARAGPATRPEPNAAHVAIMRLLIIFIGSPPAVITPLLAPLTDGDDGCDDTRQTQQ